VTILNNPRRVNNHIENALQGVGYMYDTSHKLQLKEIIEDEIDGVELVVDE